VNGYLLDTNICIYYIKGTYDLDQKFDAVDDRSLFISEITLAELKFGVENSAFPDKNRYPPSHPYQFSPKNRSFKT
jgi:tRNA(fMet)-specific endonuclease VapC